MTMEVLNLITQLERNLKAFLRLRPDPRAPEAWHLDVQLYYEGERAGTTTFNLQGYTQDEAEDVARNLRHNDFLMHEIDQFLWGESD